MSGDGELAAQIKKDYRLAGLDPATRGLIDFAIRLTRRPADSSQARVDALRALGWSDEAIVMATHIVGFFNYYTRLVEALGCEPEDFMKEG